MMRTPAFRLGRRAFGMVQTRSYTKRPTGVRHLQSISDFTSEEFAQLVKNAYAHKKAIKAGNIPKALSTCLSGQTVAMMFNKRSTRTRVSTEVATALMGGHPMFLGKDDIQLGVNESAYDTAKIISSMTSCIVARVGPHADIVNLIRGSSVPIINALSNDFHPLQAVADFLTLYEEFQPQRSLSRLSQPLLVPRDLKVAWIGDSNNVLFDLAIACMKVGVQISVASPRGYGIPANMLALIRSQAETSNTPGKIYTTDSPEEALKDADVIVTDTWVSMGQEDEYQRRMKAFEGFQVTPELIARAGANPQWKFMHCLPRHKEEVSDKVFYSPQSLVFQEGENRLWAAIAVLEAFVVNKGLILE